MLVATTNPGKIREIRRVLDPLAIPLCTLRDVPTVEEPDETGQTFAENALLKARHYADATGLLTVAEDSGLVIEALGGRPGVESARYPGATYAEKFKNLYAELAAHPRPWTGRYVSAVAVVDGRASSRTRQAQDIEPRAPLFACEAAVDGEIWPEPRGSRGFGYDPIFYYPAYAATFGEVEDERKLLVAHRGRAFRLVAEWVRRMPPVLFKRPSAV